MASLVGGVSVVCPGHVLLWEAGYHYTPVSHQPAAEKDMKICNKAKVKVHLHLLTHRELFDPSAWCLGIVPQSHLRHGYRLVKQDIQVIDELRQYGSQPHVTTVISVMDTIYQLVHRPYVTFDPWEDIDAVWKCSNI